MLLAYDYWLSPKPVQCYRCSVAISLGSLDAATASWGQEGLMAQARVVLYSSASAPESCPVQVRFVSYRHRLHGLSVICRSLLPIRSCFSVSWVPKHNPGPVQHHAPEHQPAAAVCLTRSTAGQATLSQPPSGAEARESPSPSQVPGPRCTLGTQVTADPPSILPLSMPPVSQARVTMGTGWGSEGAKAGWHKEYCDWEVTSPWGLLDSYRGGKCW